RPRRCRPRAPPHRRKAARPRVHTSGSASSSSLPRPVLLAASAETEPPPSDSVNESFRRPADASCTENGVGRATWSQRRPAWRTGAGWRGDFTGARLPGSDRWWSSMMSQYGICLASILCVPALAEGEGGAPRTMKASLVEGFVTLQQGKGTAQPLAQGAPLQEGDVVQTGVASHLEISISDGSTLRLGEKTRLELRVAPAAGKAFAARLWLGAVWARVHKL